MEEKSGTYSAIEGMGALWGGYPGESIFDKVRVVHRGGGDDIPRV